MMWLLLIIYLVMSVLHDTWKELGFRKTNWTYLLMPIFKFVVGFFSGKDLNLGELSFCNADLPK